MCVLGVYNVLKILILLLMDDVKRTKPRIVCKSQISCGDISHTAHNRVSNFGFAFFCVEIWFFIKGQLFLRTTSFCFIPCKELDSCFDDLEGIYRTKIYQKWPYGIILVIWIIDMYIVQINEKKSKQ